MSSGTFGTNWLDLSSTSNLYNRMYVQGFMDISGGNLILRNNNLYMTGGDLSLNGRLFVNADISFNNRLFLPSDASLGGRLFLSSDASLNGRLFVAGDLSTNGNVTFNSTISYATTSIGKWNAQNLLPINGNWTSISQTANGQYALAAQNTGSLYLTNTFGSSWTQITSVPTGGAWTGVAMSSTSQYMMATTNGAGVYLSPYYGASGSWVQVPTSTLPTGGNYMNAAMSSTGQYMLVANNTSGAVYMNTGYGVSGSWGPIPSTILATNVAWAGLAMSSTGQYMLAGQNTGSVYLSFNTGQSWLQISSSNLPTNGAWQSLAMSSRGQYMLAGNNSAGSVYLSTTFGTIWTQISTTLPTNGNWYNVTVSPTGQYMMAVNNSAGSAYISTNYGSTWSQVTALPTSSAWSALSLSSTGLYNMVAVKGGAIYTCTFPNTSTANYVTNMFGSIGVNNPTPQYTLDVSGTVNTSQGLTTTGITSAGTGAFQSNWALASGLPTNGTWYTGNAAMSSTGQYMLAAAGGGAVYLTNNYGFSWNMVPNTSLPTNVNWRTVSISSTGQYMLACVATASSNTYLSSNYGTTWSAVSALSTAYWYTVCCSSTGQYMLAGVTGGIIYLNTNYGIGSWSSITTVLPTNGTWSASAISSTGQYMLVGNVSGGIGSTTGAFYISNNYGSTWSMAANGLPTASAPWQCSMTSTGQYMIAVFNIGSSYQDTAYLTTNYGESWVPLPLYGNYFNTAVISATGQYMFAASSNTYGVWTSTNYGSTWNTVPQLTMSSASSNLNCAAISANGQYILTGNNNGQIYLNSGTPITTMGINNPTPQYALDHTGSFNLNNMITSGTNYGAPATWANISSVGIQNGQGLAMSYTGQYMLFSTSNSGVYLSQNYGVTWAQLSTSTFATSGNWEAPSISNNGQYMLICGSGIGVYLSTNYGYTWSLISTYILPTSYSWYASAMSSTGQYMLAGPYSVSQSSMYLSTNYGVSWTQIANTSIPNNIGFISAAISLNGQYMLTGSFAKTGYLYLSTNYGVTWSPIPSTTGVVTNSQWYQIAMSSSGQYMGAAANAGYIYISSNYGVKWTQTALPISTSQNNIAFSGTGQYMYAANTAGSYYSNNYGATWTNLNTGNNANWRYACVSGTGQYMGNSNNVGGPLCISYGTQTVGINNPNPQTALDVIGTVRHQNPYWIVQGGNSGWTAVAAGGKIPFSLIYQSNAACYFNTNTYTLYAPITGRYFISVGYYWDTATRMGIYKNGVYYSNIGGDTQLNTVYTASDMLYLNAGDNINIVTTSALNVYMSNVAGPSSEPLHTVFRACFLG